MRFYCWITLLTPAAIDGFIGGIVRKGRGVEPMAGDGTLTDSTSEDIGQYIAIEINTLAVEDRDADDVLSAVEADVSSVIEERGIKHFGFCLAAVDNGDLVRTWVAGNVKASSLPAAPPTQPPPAWGRLGKASS